MNIEAAQQAMKEGRLSDAKKHLILALKSQPSRPELHYNLAMVLIKQKDFAGAAEYFSNCLSFAPNNVELLNNVGNSQRLCGQHDAALKHLNQALDIAPAHIGARCNRAWLLLKTGQIKQAAEDFSRVTKASKEFSDAWRGLAEAHIALNDFDAAHSSLKKSLALFPQSADLHNTLGTLHIKQRETEQALVCFEQALALSPLHAEASINHGITCEQLGRETDAEKSLLRALEARPGFAAAHFHLAHLACHQVTPSEIKAMKRALTHEKSNTNLINLHFAMGKALAKQQLSDEAFPHFIAARQYLSHEQTFDQQKSMNLFTEIKACHHQPASSTGVSTIFVVGMPRSGTTLTDQILASHPQTHAMGESGVINKLLKAYKEQTSHAYPTGFNELSAQGKNELSQFLSTAINPTGETIINIDTSPSNFLYLGLLAELLPDARFVHCSRDPLDTCVSIFEHPLSHDHSYANSLTDLGTYYQRYRDLVTHWQTLLGGRLFTLSYEELLENPREQIAKLLQHCGLEFDEQCLSFYQTERAILTPSASQVRKPLNKDSIGRWRAYEKHLGPLLQLLPN